MQGFYARAQCPVQPKRQRGPRPHAFPHDDLVELAVEAGGLGAVLVGVAEHPDRVEPGRDQEALELGDVGLGLAGEADDDVGADAGLGRRRADLRRAARGSARCRRSGASGAARGALACWKDRSKYGATPGVVAMTSTSAGPHLGGLQVGHPDPVDARRPRPARAAASRAAAGRRGPCRTTWSSR